MSDLSQVEQVLIDAWHSSLFKRTFSVPSVLCIPTVVAFVKSPPLRGLECRQLSTGLGRVCALLRWGELVAEEVEPGVFIICQERPLDGELISSPHEVDLVGRDVKQHLFKYSHPLAVEVGE